MSILLPRKTQHIAGDEESGYIRSPLQYISDDELRDFFIPSQLQQTFLATTNIMSEKPVKLLQEQLEEQRKQATEQLEEQRKQHKEQLELIMTVLKGTG